MRRHERKCGPLSVFSLALIIWPVSQHPGSQLAASVMSFLSHSLLVSAGGGGADGAADPTRALLPAGWTLPRPLTKVKVAIRLSSEPLYYSTTPRGQEGVVLTASISQTQQHI